jgi:hypothetical protein
MKAYFETTIAKYIGVTAAAVYERLRFLASKEMPDEAYPDISYSIAQLSADFCVPLKTMQRTMNALVNYQLLARKRSKHTVVWSILANEEQAIAWLERIEATDWSYQQMKDKRRERNRRNGMNFKGQGGLSTTEAKVAVVEAEKSQSGRSQSDMDKPEWPFSTSQSGRSQTEDTICTPVRGDLREKDNTEKKEDSSKEECKKEPPKSADADIPPKGNLPIAQPAPSPSKPKRPAEEHALIRNLHWVSEQHRLLCLEEGREVKFEYHQLDPLQDYEASDGSLVWAKFCTGREKLQKSNKAKSWDVDKAIAILCKLCNSFALNGEEATLDKFRECADEGKQGFEVSWVRKPKQQKSNEVLDVKPGDPEIERFMGLMYSTSAKPQTSSTPKLKVINPTPKLKVVNDR